MTAYIDSSVLLRIVLRQPGSLKEWKAIRRGVASALVETECLRTLDRLRLRFGLPDRQIAIRREAIFRLLEAMELVELTRPILARASQLPPVELGTMDAIHLATAMLWREMTQTDVVMATHDEALGLAARACGIRVVGVRE